MKGIDAMKTVLVRKLTSLEERLDYILDDIRHHNKLPNYKTTDLKVDEILNEFINKELIEQEIPKIEFSILSVYTNILGYILGMGMSNERVIQDLMKSPKLGDNPSLVDTFSATLRAFASKVQEENTVSYDLLIEAARLLMALGDALDVYVVYRLTERRGSVFVGREYNHYIQFSPHLKEYTERVYSRAKQAGKKQIVQRYGDHFTKFVKHMDNLPKIDVLSDVYLDLLTALLIKLHEDSIECLAAHYMDIQGEEGLPNFTRDLETQPISDMSLTTYNVFESLEYLSTMYLPDVQTPYHLRIQWNFYFLILNIFRNLGIDPIECYMEDTKSLLVTQN